MQNGAPPDMVWIPGGSFLMGSDRHYPEEAPTCMRTVEDFWIDRTPVTNRQFSLFVRATGYLTTAERPPDLCAFPSRSARVSLPGSLVFSPSGDGSDMLSTRSWWKFQFGADWRHPLGPGSSVSGLESHPVVHVSYWDALSFSNWAGKDLPTEAEWEYVARGGLSQAEYAWGDEFTPDGKYMANTWQGTFPYKNLCLDGFERTSPVRAFPANPYGVCDMIGNVWEWTSDYYRSDRGPVSVHMHDQNKQDVIFDKENPSLNILRRVVKGGSHLCAANYCKRYRPAARHPQSVDTSTCHIGFRCVVRR